MKKLLGLLLSVALVFSLAVPVYAEAGSAEEPIFLMATQSEVTVPANATVYCQGWFAGMELTVAGEGDFAVIYNGETIAAENGIASFVAVAGMGRMPVDFAIVGTEVEAIYQVSADYPAGTMMNPKVLDTLEYEFLSVSLPEGDNQGYYYTWTATADGTVSIWLSDVTEGANADVILFNMMSYQQLSISMDGVEDEWGDKILSMDVSADDVLQIQVVSLPDADWNIPAADITAIATFAEPAGTVNNPIALSPDWETNQYDDITVPANTTTYYMGRFGGMTVAITGEGAFTVICNGEELQSVDGVVSFDVPDMGMMAPPTVFAIVGADADATYQFSATYPEGTQMNPEVLDDEIGNLSVSLEEGNYMGYFYTWTATEDGTLSIQISDITEGVEADVVLFNTNTYEQLSLSLEGVEDESGNMVVSMDVTAGDVIQIQVVSLPDADWNIPAADITAVATFDNGQEPVVPGDPENPEDDETKDPVDDENKDPVDDENKDPVDDENKDPVDDENKDPVDDENKDPVDDETKDPVEETPKTTDAGMIAAVVALLIAGSVVTLVNKKRVFSK